MKMSKIRPLVVVSVVAILALTLLVVQLSAQGGAVVPDIGFEIEGNVALDQGGDYDWETLEFLSEVLIADPNSKATEDLTTFHPDSKFDKPEDWSILPAQVGPGQNELTNILAWGILPGDLADDRPEHFWLVLGMERTKKEGTFALDFEFNQVAWDGTSGGPTRRPGDLAVGFELKGNPTDKQSDLQVLIIQYLPGAQPSLCSATPGPGHTPALVEVGTDPCPPYGDSGWFYRFLADGTILADSGLGQATMNEDPFPVPWPSTDAQGNPRSVIGPFQFAEAAIDLTALGVEASCATFSTVHAKSRSSLEVGSDLKDLAGPAPFNVNCRLDGHKFLDVNGNGLWDQPDEPPLEGWEIALDDGSVTSTDADGYYAFEDLEDGSYTVSEVCPDAWVQTAPGFTDFDTCGTITHAAELDLDHREVNNLDFGNGRPALDLVKACPSDVFLGDDIAYTITVTNTGNVWLQGIEVSDPLLGLSGTVDLGPGESETFFASLDSMQPGIRPGGGYHLFLPLVMRAGMSQSAPPIDPVPDVRFGDVITNTTTATSEYALATITASDSCVTTVHEPQVRKDAQTSFTRTYKWTIDKTVDDPGPIVLVPGTVATPHYTVTVDLGDPPYVDSNWAVEGTIVVENPAPMDAVLASVIDTVSPGIAATVNCPELIVPAGGSLTCTYGPVQLPDGSSRVNMATAALRNNNGRTTDFSATANVDFSQAHIELIDEEVQVFDSFGEPPPPEPELLGTVRYDEVAVTFTYSRTIQAAGAICELFEVPNMATLVTNDSGTTISDETNVRVQILELCTVTAAYEDLPVGAKLDWDYNDWVTTLNLQAQVSDPSGGGGLLRLDLAIGPEARGAMHEHVFHLRFPAGTFPCNGTSTQTLFDGDGNILQQDVRPFDGSVTTDFTVIPWTADAFPAMSNTDESKPYIPTGRTALLSIDFPDPCPFEPGEFDPVTSVHGEGLFFEPYLHVVGSGDDIGEGDSRTLIIPVDWMWPEERIAIWLAYPDVVVGNPPTFGPLWWRNSTDLVYDGKP